MQSSTYYVSNTNNTYGWQAYPATQRSAFICEVRGCRAQADSPRQINHMHTADV